jgi:hypothetical protein
MDNGHGSVMHIQQEDAARTCRFPPQKCSTDMGMQHGHGHAAHRKFRGLVARTCSVEKQHGHAVCAHCTDMKHGEAAWMHLGDAALKCTLDMQQELTAWTCRVDMPRGHAARACSTDMRYDAV